MTPRSAVLYIQQRLIELDIECAVLKPFILYPGVQPWEFEAWGCGGAIVQAIKIHDIDREGSTGVFAVWDGGSLLCSNEATFERVVSQPFPSAHVKDSGFNITTALVDPEDMAKLFVESLINARLTQP